MLMPENGVAVGDYVLIQLGNVQKIVPEEDAMESYKLFEDILEKLPGSTPGA